MPLFLVRNEKGKRNEWKTLDQVYWTGPSFLCSKFVLSLIFPLLEMFFTERLGVPFRPSNDVLLEDIQLSLQDQLGRSVADEHERRMGILAELADMMVKEPDAKWMTSLVELPLFPAKTPEGDVSFRKLGDLFIPDKGRRIARIFETSPKVAFLDISNLRRFGGLLEYPCFEAKARYLEKLVSVTVKPSGAEAVHEFTAEYRTRVPLIAWYAVPLSGLWGNAN